MTTLCKTKDTDKDVTYSKYRNVFACKAMLVEVDYPSFAHIAYSTTYNLHTDTDCLTMLNVKLKSLSHAITH